MLVSLFVECEPALSLTVLSVLTAVLEPAFSAAELLDGFVLVLLLVLDEPVDIGAVALAAAAGLELPVETAVLEVAVGFTLAIGEAVAAADGVAVPIGVGEMRALVAVGEAVGEAVTIGEAEAVAVAIGVATGVAKGVADGAIVAFVWALVPAE